MLKSLIAASAVVAALGFAPQASAAPITPPSPAGPSDPASHVHGDAVLCALNAAFANRHKSQCVGLTNVEICCSNGGGYTGPDIRNPGSGDGGTPGGGTGGGQTGS